MYYDLDIMSNLKKRYFLYLGLVTQNSSVILIH